MLFEDTVEGLVGSEVKKENGPFDAGFVVGAEKARKEKDAPKKAHHHGKRYN